MRKLRGLPLALVVATVTILLDRVTKVWAERRLVAGPCTPGGDECIDVLLSLRFHLVYNYGAAFSTGIGFGPVFAVLAAIMSVVLFRLAATSGDRLRAGLFGLIAGGAIGNLIDRVARAEDGWLSGGVIDFIDLQWWPVFNIADMAVVSGVVVFVIHSLVVGEEDPSARTSAAPAATTGGDPAEGAGPGDRDGADSPGTRS